MAPNGYHALAGKQTDDCRLDIIEGTKHFSVLDVSCDPEHPAGQRVLAFIGGRG